jgi:hypothetical protein
MSQSSPHTDGCHDLAALGRRASLECRSKGPLASPRWTNPFDLTGCSWYQHRFHILFGGIGLSSGLRRILAPVRTRIRIRGPLSWRKKRLLIPGRKAPPCIVGLLWVWTALQCRSGL